MNFGYGVAKSLPIKCSTRIRSIQRESIVIVKRFRTRDFDESPRFEPPESEKHNFGTMSVCEHDNSKTITARVMTFEPKTISQTDDKQIPESDPNAKKQSKLQFKGSEKREEPCIYFGGSERIEGGKVQYFCLKGLVKNFTAVVCEQHKPFSQGCESLTSTKGLFYAVSNFFLGRGHSVGG
ncbi:hypothetical protein AVEN_75320-1 [Araneus ventricosus]|uniref:Uncharacterized protein n=1 Tax=Araneus ventricosus TaxID=182803 RepID=A0A4Y2G3U6_ARAVE|nr:hypothetical protein AVEN_75320-1 [Araneus ventricosus]